MRSHRHRASEPLDISDDQTLRGTLTVRISAVAADTIANGESFGGWVLSRMD